jgi:3,4-dihydroxy-2-butanone 4-phosphate synthase
METKFVPFTVSVNAAPPAARVLGFSEVIVGAGLFTVKLVAVEIPPPGAGFVTVTGNVPAAAISAAVIAAVICVPLTNVVVRAFPLNFTAEAATNPVPFTVNVNAAPPAVALAGESVVMVGTGLFTVKATAFDVPPPGIPFVTVTGNVPAVAMSAAVMAAVICVALTNVVVFAFPLNFTAEATTNPVPFTVNVNAAPPAVALVGDSVVTVGTGLFTVKVTAFDVPPPGAGFVTVTGGVPAEARSLAKIAAVICVALTNVVVLVVPLKFTTDVFTKLVPFTVNVNAPEPSVALGGDSVVTVGTGFVATFTTSVNTADVLPEKFASPP